VAAAEICSTGSDSGGRGSRRHVDPGRVRVDLGPQRVAPVPWRALMAGGSSSSPRRPGPWWAGWRRRNQSHVAQNGFLMGK
jgi:hypothetical protein